MDKKKYIIAGLIILIAAIAVFVVPSFNKEGLKSAIAKALNTSEEYISINIPPSAARYPGAILLPHNDSFLIFSSGLDDSDERIIKGVNFNVEAQLDQEISVLGKPSFGALSTVFSNNEHFEIILSITDGEVLELKVDDLKDLISDNESVRNVADNRKEPIILNKAYRGVVTYKIKAKDDKGVEILAELKPELRDISDRTHELSIDGSMNSNSELGLTIEEPIIIAFESLGVRFIADNLSPDNAAFVSINSQKNMSEIQASLEDSTLNVDTKQTELEWGLITIGSGHFSRMGTKDVPEAVASAKIVSAIFSTYDPAFEFSLISTSNDPVTEEEVLQASIDLTMKMLSDPVDYLVIYYVGHGLSLPNGEMMLLEGDIDKDFAERATETMTPQTGVSDDGLILTETLYTAFEMTGVPFTLILDACYPNDEMQEALDRISMTTVGEDGTGLIYYGNQTLITDEISEIGDVISQIGQRFEYRAGTNPIIFSSKPGAKALFNENPYSYFDYELAPLASRIAKIVRYNNEFNQIPLSEVITNITDFRAGVGEISLSGSITWSSLDLMQSELDKVYSKENLSNIDY